MSVHLKIEESGEGLLATLAQRDGDGKLIGHPSVRPVANAAEAKQQAKTLAKSLGLKVYGFIDKTKSAARPKQLAKAIADAGDGSPDAADEERPPWLVPGVGKAL